MKKYNGRPVIRSKASYILCWMFGNSLEKVPESAKTNIPTSFRNFWKFLKIFGNLRKSSDVRKSSEKFGNCPKVLKTIFQHFWSFLIFGNLRKSSEVFGKNLKMSENSQNDLPTIFEDFRKFSKIFESVRKCSENFGNPQKIFECIWRFTKIFISSQYLKPMDWRSDSRILICNLHWYYAFCTGVTL